MQCLTSNSRIRSYQKDSEMKSCLRTVALTWAPFFSAGQSSLLAGKCSNTSAPIRLLRRLLIWQPVTWAYSLPPLDLIVARAYSGRGSNVSASFPSSTVIMGNLHLWRFQLAALRIAGSTNRWNVTKADTGFPGSPKNIQSWSALWANVRGFLERKRA